MKQRCSWSGLGRKWPLVVVQSVDPRHGKIRKRVRRVRQIKEKRIGEEGGARAHQSCQNRADTLADAEDSGDEFRRPGGDLEGKGKGEGGGGPGPFIGVGGGAELIKE
jgi:hypothetical protein